jgi:hypothetical protein
MDLGDVSVDQHRMVELLFAKSEKKKKFDINTSNTGKWHGTKSDF